MNTKQRIDIPNLFPIIVVTILLVIFISMFINKKVDEKNKNKIYHAKNLALSLNKVHIPYETLIINNKQTLAESLTDDNYEELYDNYVNETEDVKLDKNKKFNNYVNNNLRLSSISINADNSVIFGKN